MKFLSIPYTYNNVMKTGIHGFFSSWSDAMGIAMGSPATSIPGIINLIDTPRALRKSIALDAVLTVLGLG